MPAAEEVARGEFFDLDALDGLGVEIPIKACQALEFGEMRLADAACGAAFAAEAGLVGDEAVQELQVGAAVLGSLGQGAVEVGGGQGDTQYAKVGQDTLTQVLGRRRRLGWSHWWLRWGAAGHCCKPPALVNVDSPLWVVRSRDRRAGTVRGAGVPVRPSRPGCSWAWQWRPGCVPQRSGHRRRNGPLVPGPPASPPVRSRPTAPRRAGPGICPDAAWPPSRRGSSGLSVPIR